MQLCVGLPEIKTTKKITKNLFYFNIFTYIYDGARGVTVLGGVVKVKV
jgi:hypothetical protein